MISSPLRYPGGKAKLYPFFAKLIQQNGLIGADYSEPYAGGAGLAIRLLTDGLVGRISINDVDLSIYSFWIAVLQYTDQLCSLIEKTPITIDQWYLQKRIWLDGDINDPLRLGFAAYYLNRTNRSGIIDGAGPIGGYGQGGAWKIDVRLVKHVQIENIRAISNYRHQIMVTNQDASIFLRTAFRNSNALVYLDPPYFEKGRKLYKNYYETEDHRRIARALERRRNAKWVVSYDDVPEIRRAYSAFAPITYSLNYCAGPKTVGTEVIFVSDSIRPPAMEGFRRAA